MSRASVGAALTRVSLRLAVVRQAAGYWSCFDCSASLDSGSFSGKPATVSVSSSPGFEALSAASSGRSCVDSLTAISLVAVAGGYPAGAAATLRHGRPDGPTRLGFSGRVADRPDVRGDLAAGSGRWRARQRPD